MNSSITASESAAVAQGSLHQSTAVSNHPQAMMSQFAADAPVLVQQQPIQSRVSNMAAQPTVTHQQQSTVQHGVVTHRPIGDPIVQQQDPVASLPAQTPLKKIPGHLGWYRFAGALSADPFEPGTKYTVEKFLFRYLEVTQNGALDGQPFNEKDGTGNIVGRKIFKAKKGDQITEGARVELENLKDSLNEDFDAYLEPQVEKRLLELAIRFGVHDAQNGVSTADVLSSCKNISVANDVERIASIMKVKTLMCERNFILHLVYSFFAEKGLRPVILKPHVSVNGSLCSIEFKKANQSGCTGLYYYQHAMFKGPRQMKRKITMACPQSKQRQGGPKKKQRQGGTRVTVTMQLAASLQLLSQVAGLAKEATPAELTPAGNTLDLIKALLEEAKIEPSGNPVSDKGDGSDTVPQQPASLAAAGSSTNSASSLVEREATDHVDGGRHVFTQEEIQGMSNFRFAHQEQPPFQVSASIHAILLMN